MSAIVRTRTPFLHRTILLQALERIGEPYDIGGDGAIYTSRTDYYGRQVFEQKGSSYVLRHDSSADKGNRPYPWGNLRNSPWMLVRDFLAAVQKAYNDILNEEAEKLEHIEQERIAAEEAERLRREAAAREAARLAYIQAQEQAITERARAAGYHVSRKEVGGKIRITLSRTS